MHVFPHDPLAPGHLRATTGSVKIGADERTHHKQGEEDNQNQILLGPELFHMNATFSRS